MKHDSITRVRSQNIITADNHIAHIAQLFMDKMSLPNLQVANPGVKKTIKAFVQKQKSLRKIYLVLLSVSQNW